MKQPKYQHLRHLMPREGGAATDRARENTQRAVETTVGALYNSGSKSISQLHHRTTQGARRKNRKPLKRTHHPTQHGTSGLEGLLRLPSAKKRPWGGFWGLNTKKGQAFGENNYKSSRSCTPQSLLFCFE